MIQDENAVTIAALQLRIDELEQQQAQTAAFIAGFEEKLKAIVEEYAVASDSPGWKSVDLDRYYVANDIYTVYRSLQRAMRKDGE